MIILDEKTFTYLYIVIPAMLKQGKKSVDDNDTCRYRGSDNTCCAVGFYIPEIEYCPSIEGDCVLSGVGVSLSGIGLLTETMLSISTIKDIHPKILNDMQGIHDGCFAHHWEGAFNEQFPEVMQLLKLDGLV